MKNTLRRVFALLLLAALAACQPATLPPSPTEDRVAEFFADQAGRRISILLPTGWVAQLAGTEITPMIVVTDNIKKYENDAEDAIGIIVVPLTDTGTAAEVLGVSIERLAGSLKEQIGEVVTEQSAGHGYALAEYQGNSVDDGLPVYYFLAVVATEQRSTLIFTTVAPGEQQAMRPHFQTIVTSVRLH
jgi:hypothetical protein